ncbi:acylphosphatase [Aquisalimonas sp.]|uniref:acylphosphatase n=1 Tax=Aquisalimonas sp. TaxID=1872621 RepID=UPI0025B80089|nr:acylphosphatase [Aquisalimonas sp.]
MSEICILGHVSGRVQGVFFRGTTQEEARRLGLRGYAQNLPDGRVRILASGPPEALESFREWVAQGPPNARVEEVHWQEVDEEPPAGFQVR